MKEVTRAMLSIYKMKKLKYDFMGYTFKSPSELTYHHLLIPNKFNGPDIFCNGAILNQKTSHDYLHRIERIDEDIFYDITSEMIDMNIKSYLDIKNLKLIRKLLLEFEKKHYYDKNNKSKYIIKKEYINDRIKL